MQIRDVTEEDTPRLVELGRMIHFESRYAAFNFNPEKFAARVRHAAGQQLAFVAEASGDIVGFFLGVVDTHFFGDDKVSYDMVTFVLPDRRGSAGVSLIREYIRRARALGVSDIHIGTSTGVNTVRMSALYRKLGFRSVGGIYAMEA
jgi:hypothetical protein